MGINSILLVAALYLGPTEYGGDYNKGSVFSADRQGHRTTIYSFCPNEGCGDGANPLSNVIQLPDGSIVGTTSNAGDYGFGTIFRLFQTPNGWRYSKLWGVCWVLDDCGRYGTPHGTLQYMGINGKGYFVIDGVCETEEHRIVFYELIITPHNGQAIMPIRYWKE